MCFFPKQIFYREGLLLAEGNSKLPGKPPPLEGGGLGGVDSIEGKWNVCMKFMAFPPPLQKRKLFPPNDCTHLARGRPRLVLGEKEAVGG